MPMCIVVKSKISLFPRASSHINPTNINILVKQIIISSSIIKYFIILRTSVLSVLELCFEQKLSMACYLFLNYTKQYSTCCKFLKHGRCPIWAKTPPSQSHVILYTPMKNHAQFYSIKQTCMHTDIHL